MTDNNNNNSSPIQPNTNTQIDQLNQIQQFQNNNNGSSRIYGQMNFANGQQRMGQTGHLNMLQGQAQAQLLGPNNSVFIYFY